MNFIVYRHCSPSGKSYIGVTSRSVEERFNEHVRLAKRENIYHFHQAINKYGAESFITEILEENVPSTKIVESEKFWIKKFDSFKNGYNMTEGGQGHTAGFKHTEETKKKISESHLGKILTDEHKKNIGLASSKQIHTVERRLEQSERMKGKKLSNETKKKISETLKTKMSGDGNGMFGKKHKRVTCEHCNKEVSTPMYKRWHGVKCKELNNE